MIWIWQICKNMHPHFADGAFKLAAASGCRSDSDGCYSSPAAAILQWHPLLLRLPGYPRITQSENIILTYPWLCKSGYLIPTYPWICKSRHLIPTYPRLFLSTKSIHRDRDIPGYPDLPRVSFFQMPRLKLGCHEWQALPAACQGKKVDEKFITYQEKCHMCVTFSMSKWRVLGAS